MTDPKAIRLADTIAAIWVVGGDGGSLPVGSGHLDRALKSLVEAGLLPDMDLTFSTTCVGLRCLELDDALLWGVAAMLFEIEATSFTAVRPTLDLDLARQLAVGLGMGTARADAAGRALAAALGR